MFQFACFCSAIYMTLLMLLRYSANEDTSIVSYNPFFSNQKEYPTFAVCLTGHPETIVTNKVQELGITQREYISILKGYETKMNNKYAFKSVIDSKFENMTTQLRTIISGLKYERYDGRESVFYGNLGEPDKDTSGDLDKLAYISYVDTDRFCFSRREELEKKSTRKKDEIILHLSTLNDALWSDEATLQIVFHIPGQLRRKLKQPSQILKLKEITDHHDRSTEMSLTLAYVSVLRKRPDAATKCDKNLKDEDTEFNRKIVKEVGCIPTYWNDTLSGIDLGLCRSSQMLKSAYKITNNPIKILQSYDKPCNDALITVTSERKKIPASHSVSISITYTTETYQEIRNERAFGIEALGSGVGGFIGIFLGYSLLQVPELFEMDWNAYKKTLLEMCNVTKLFGVVLNLAGFKRKRIYK